MALVSLEPTELKRLVRQRRESGADRFDEVWDGVYVMAPLADNEHQRLGLDLAIAMREALGLEGQSQIFAGCNVSDQPRRWRRNYRCPDVAVFLQGCRAQDRRTHWYGGPDFAVEIISPFDKSREKLGFYLRVGVRELLLVDRRPWGLELHRTEHGEWWNLVGRADLEESRCLLSSQVLGLTFRLVPDVPRPRIEVGRADSETKWLV